MTVVPGDDAYKQKVDDQPIPLTQAEFNDLTQDLNLSKESAQLLDSHLKEKHLLARGTTFYWYQDCEKELRQFFMFYHWLIATKLLDWSNQQAWSMMLWNGDFLLTHPAEVSKQFFYIMGIVFHLSLLGIQYKWKKLTTAWIICCMYLTTMWRGP